MAQLTDTSLSAASGPSGDEFSARVSPPGGPDAVAQGCKCSILANADYRAGAAEQPLIDPICAVHAVAERDGNDPVMTPTLGPQPVLQNGTTLDPPVTRPSPCPRNPSVAVTGVG
ncbi:hypothetical protein [Pseudonocardia parietis]|uniref:Uncharacterized protein n=1 Tax=Pseudonocardia parietis TaxID=570936 RepID=A0ABS4W6G0_9PSEU|nr:hypothetical protein [Pseudonocardia parietis]MBP2371795.1 hypothetical protein [Pseudonocardia parietis]